jgi:hypothetical protein
MTRQSQKTQWKPVTPTKSPQKQTRKSPRKPPTPRISARTMTIRSYTEWPISEKNKIIEWMRDNLDYWKQGNATGAAKRRRMFEDIEWDQKYNWTQTQVDNAWKTLFKGYKTQKGRKNTTGAGLTNKELKAGCNNLSGINLFYLTNS